MEIVHLTRIPTNIPPTNHNDAVHTYPLNVYCTQSSFILRCDHKNSVLYGEIRKFPCNLHRIFLKILILHVFSIGKRYFFPLNKLFYKHFKFTTTTKNSIRQISIFFHRGISSTQYFFQRLAIV